MPVNMLEMRDAAGVATRIPETAVQTILREASETGEPFCVVHRAYHSTRTLVFDVRDARPTSSVFTQAFAYLTGQRNLSFFNYKLGDSISDGTGVDRPADDADTCLTEARRTPNQETAAIGAISFGQRNVRLQYSDAAIASAVAASGGVALSAQTIALLKGQMPFWDPASLISPAQVDAPFNLHRGFETLLRPFIKFESVWNGKTTMYHGMASAFPNTTAVPHIAAQGVAKLDNAFMIPEGLIWRANGAPRDSELEIRATLTRDLGVPISLPPFPLLGSVGTDPPPARFFPERIFVDVTVYLHAVCIGQASQNAG